MNPTASLVAIILLSLTVAGLAVALAVRHAWDTPRVPVNMCETAFLTREACSVIYNEAGAAPEAPVSLENMEAGDRRRLAQLQLHLMASSLQPVRSTIKTGLQKYSQHLPPQRWLPMPTSHSRFLYNPTLVPKGDGTFDAYMRHDSYIIKGADKGYAHCLFDLDGSVGDVGTVQVDDVHAPGKDIQVSTIAQLRTGDATDGPVMIEDLRYVTSSDPAFPNMLMGVSLLACEPRYSTRIVLMEQRSPLQLTRLASFPSPHGCPVEKNWIGLRTGEHSVRIVYNMFPTTEVYDVTGPDYTMPANPTISRSAGDIPREWDAAIHEGLPANTRNNPMRMSAVLPLPGGKEMMVLLHSRADTTSDELFYMHFCMYVDAQTWAPTRYVDIPILTDIAVGISFVTQIVDMEDKGCYGFVMGLGDRIAGVRSYRKQDLQARTRPWRTRRSMLAAARKGSA